MLKPKRISVFANHSRPLSCKSHQWLDLFVQAKQHLLCKMPKDWELRDFEQSQSSERNEIATGEVLELKNS